MDIENDNLGLNEEIENDNSENISHSEEQSEDNSKKKEPEYSDRERKLFARAKNNEDAAKLLREQGFERKNGQWVKPEPQKEPLRSQSNEPDYAKLAFLEQRGLAHPDDQKIVQDEAKRLNLPLTDVLNMEHIKARLATIKDQREASAGMPRGSGSGSGKTQQDVDYWLAKGETPDDLELAEKVINTRMQKEKSGNMFSEELY